MKTKNRRCALLEDNKDPESARFEDQDKANVLQKQFSSVFTREPDTDIPKLDKNTDASMIIYTLFLTNERVREEILNLNVNKSCGPDNVHPRLLIELAENLSKPISLLLNRSMEEGDIPTEWKSANVSPIYKKGSKNKAENYRPISLTSIICKIMESFTKDRVLAHFTSNNLALFQAIRIHKRKVHYYAVVKVPRQMH